MSFVHGHCGHTQDNVLVSLHAFKMNLSRVSICKRKTSPRPIKTNSSIKQYHVVKLEVKKKQFTLGMTADKTELNLAETLKGMCFSSGVVKLHDFEDRRWEVNGEVFGNFHRSRWRNTNDSMINL